MAARDIPYPLLIQTDRTTGSRGDVIVQNLSQEVGNEGLDNSSLIGELDSKQQITLDLANMKINYKNADVIEIRITGPKSGNLLHTVDTSKAPVKQVVPQTGSNYAGPSISL